jgi:hypothetical protein
MVEHEQGGLLVLWRVIHPGEQCGKLTVVFKVSDS